jgi:hypothetical protein
MTVHVRVPKTSTGANGLLTYRKTIGKCTLATNHTITQPSGNAAPRQSSKSPNIGTCPVVVDRPAVRQNFSESCRHVTSFEELIPGRICRFHATWLQRWTIPQMQSPTSYCGTTILL